MLSLSSPSGFTRSWNRFAIPVKRDPLWRAVLNKSSGDPMMTIDAATGRLALVNHHPTLGSTPRQFTLDPSGRFLLIADQNADAVVVLARDPASGRLSDSGQKAVLGTAMCVKLLEL